MFWVLVCTTRPDRVLKISVKKLRGGGQDRHFFKMRSDRTEWTSTQNNFFY